MTFGELEKLNRRTLGLRALCDHVLYRPWGVIAAGQLFMFL